MYLSFFNLKTKPFDLVPNPDFMFLSKTHKKAMMYLDYGIRERAGFILLTGEVGSGKTTIIREMIARRLDNAVLAKVFNTNVSSEQLIAMINDDFDLPVQGKDKISLLRDLNHFLVDQFSKGKRPLIIIDEAQNLTPETLEEIRMLSNLETSDSKLMQIILVGQPELRDTLAAAELRQLRQRISIQCHLQPLNRQEIEEYIFHRLQVAGNRNALNFTPEALDIINMYSCGIPRLVNIICDFLLLSAFAEETRDVNSEMITEILGDLDFNSHFWATAKESPEICAQINPPHITGHTPSTTQPNDHRVSEKLDAIFERLDHFEKNTLGATHESIQELKKRVDSIHNSFRLHMNKTDASVAELERKIKLQHGDRQHDKPQKTSNTPVNPKEQKSGLMHRLFGQ